MGASPDELIFESKPAETSKRNGKGFPGWWLAAVFVFLAALTYDKVVEWVGGTPQLSKKHQQQFERDSAEMETAEQYALIAKRSKFYPCLHCPSQRTFLKIGEIYRYGVTRKGQKGRYTDIFLITNDLDYLPQFMGNIHACELEERRKINRYPLLPENLARLPAERLTRPPGNLRRD